MSARRRQLLAGLLPLVLVFAIGVPASAQERGPLAEARAEIRRLEQTLDRATAAEQDAKLGLRQATRRLDELEAIVNHVGREVERQRQSVLRAQRRLDSLAADEDAARGVVERKAAQLYMSGDRGNLFSLFAAPDLKTAIASDEILTLVNANDDNMFDDLNQASRRADAARSTLQAQLTGYEDLLEQQDALLARAEELRDSRALAAARASTRAERVEERHAQARAEADRIQLAIRAAQASGGYADSADGSSPVITGGAGLGWPACGIVTSEYGWRWGRMHQGLDIDDTYTTNIAAAGNGTVISAGWNSGGYGYLTLIDHGGGVVTAYAHQSSLYVSSGQFVARGQSIGTIGTTGNSTGPHLHFEVRVGGSAVSPRGMLSGGC